MIQDMLPPIKSKARALRRPGPEWLRLLAALAILLMAVVPHVTLAATAGHMAQPASTGPAHHGAPRHDDARADALRPGHECDEPGQNAAPAMPSCCIMGCGLLSFAAEPDLAVLPARWRILAPGPAQAGKARVLEPAERPPRPQRAAI